MIRQTLLCLVWAFCAGPVWAQSISVPAGAQEVSSRPSALDSYDLPVAPFANGVLPIEAFEGRLERRSWRVDSTSLTTLQITDPIKTQLVEQGFDVIFECRDTECGGFDFRFATEVIPAPDMFVDIGDYRFLSATRGSAEAVSLLVSGGQSASYLQLISVLPTDAVTPSAVETVPVSASGPETPEATADLIDALMTQGHVVLPDLEFAQGSFILNDGPFPSLATMADFLVSRPEIRIALVGHTDSTGSLQSNLDLSKQRAEAVLSRLSEAYGVPAEQLDAHGVGYLAPLHSNATEAGREGNRRVEAILVSGS